MIVGAILMTALSAMWSASSVRSKETARGTALEESPAASAALSMRQTYRGRSLTLVRVPVATPASPDMSLDVDEMRVSPALEHRLAQDETLREWFPYRMVGEVPRHLIGSAGELIAYIGVEVPEGAFPIGAGLGAGPPGGLGYYQTIGLVVFIGLPSVALLLTASRFGSSLRRQRYYALRLLGVPTLTARLSLAVEFAVPVVVGAATVLLSLQLVDVETLRIPIVDRWVFWADAAPSLASSAIVMALVLLLSVLVGGFGSRTSPTVHRAGSLLARLDPAFPRLAVAYIIGMLLLLWSWTRQEPNDPRRWLAVLLIGAGLPSALAVVTRLLAKRLSPFTSPTLWLLAMRRITLDARSATRLAGVIAIALFAVGAAQPISQVVAQPSRSWTQDVAADGRERVVGQAEALDGTAMRLRTRPPVGTHVVVQTVGLRTQATGGLRPDATALVATCSQLSELVDASLPDCDGSRQRIGGPEGGPPSPPGFQAPTTVDLVGARPGEAASIDLSGLSTLELPPGSGVHAMLLLPPSDPALAALSEPFVSGAYLSVSATVDAWERARAWVVANSPAHRLENAFEGSDSTDSTGQWILLGILVAALFIAVATVINMLEDRQRIDEWQQVRALGVGKGKIVIVQLLQSLVIGLVSALLASASSVGLTIAYLEVNDESLHSFAPFLLAAMAGTTCLLVVTCASSLLQVNRRLGSAVRI